MTYFNIKKSKHIQVWFKIYYIKKLALNDNKLLKLFILKKKHLEMLC